MNTGYICNKCGYKIDSMKIKIKDKILDRNKDVREEFFRCPKCNAKYIVLLMDPELRRLISIGDRGAAATYAAELRKRYAD